MSFVKRGARDQMEREAACLEVLRAADTGLVIPRVLAVRDGVLEMEALETVPATADSDERLGRGLAQLHRQTAPAYGFPFPTYCGTTRQDNTPAGSWADFYRDRRLAPLVRTLVQRGAFSRDDEARHDRLAARLPDLLLPAGPPALIHGDLWSGNVLATPRGPALIDPACCHADREMELGITTLFGGLSARAIAAYEEAWPFPAGWRERNGLYQLYHLLNHAVLFGGHYVGEARATTRRYAG